MPVSDEVLVKQSKEGDLSSFEELAKRYEKKIYNLAYRITGNREDASDVLQETFLQAFRKLASFKSKAKFTTWLYRIAVNICLMRKRREKKMGTISLDIPILNKGHEQIKREFQDDWS